MRALSLVEVVVGTAILGMLLPLTALVANDLFEVEMSASTDRVVTEAFVQLHRLLVELSGEARSVSISPDGALVFSGIADTPRVHFSNGRIWLTRAGSSTALTNEDVLVSLDQRVVENDALHLDIRWRFVGSKYLEAARTTRLSLPHP